MYESMDLLRAEVRYEQRDRRASAQRARVARRTRDGRVAGVVGRLTKRDGARLRADFAAVVAESAAAGSAAVRSTVGGPTATGSQGRPVTGASGGAGR